MTMDNECVACGYKWQTTYRPVNCARCGNATVFSTVVVPSAAQIVNEPRIIPTYGTTQPNVLPTIQLEDQRRLPLDGERALATGCKCNGDSKHCCWGKDSKHDANCKYHRFEIMCDKLIGKDGKEIN